MWALLIAAGFVLVPAFLSVAVFNRGEIGAMIFVAVMGLATSFPANMAIGGIATSIKNEENITKWYISDVRQYTDDGNVLYSYRYKDHQVDKFGYNGDEIRYTDGEPYRMKNCGTPADGFFNMYECTEYIYVNEEN